MTEQHDIEDQMETYRQWLRDTPEEKQIDYSLMNGQRFNRQSTQKPTSEDAHGDWGWLTVNPRPDVSLKDFVTSAKELSQFKCFENMTYVFEQRSVDPATPLGLHLHAIFKRRLAPSTCDYKIRRKFDRFVGTAQHICLKWVDKAASEIKLNYILGSKTDTKDDPTKTAKQAVDKIWRVKNNLKESYAHPILVGALPPQQNLKKKLILRKP